MAFGGSSLISRSVLWGSERYWCRTPVILEYPYSSSPDWPVLSEWSWFFLIAWLRRTLWAPLTLYERYVRELTWDDNGIPLDDAGNLYHYLDTRKCRWYGCFRPSRRFRSCGSARSRYCRSSWTSAQSQRGGLCYCLTMPWGFWWMSQQEQGQSPMKWCSKQPKDLLLTVWGTSCWP